MSRQPPILALQAERLGVRDDVAEVKARYAVRVLHRHGARFINRFTRFTIQQLAA